MCPDATLNIPESTEKHCTFLELEFQHLCYVHVEIPIYIGTWTNIIFYCIIGMFVGNTARKKKKQ